LKEKKEGLKEGKARKGFINLNANMTSQILATNVEDLTIMRKTVESRKRLKALIVMIT